ncbi:FAD-dependent monooxygenase [Fischerella sp. JS2]|uniref:FAD-dependent monooxygenase n=1 Tax=Fischerella sp. JS2 TaxID=2597771 RepID=UPI0028E7C58E|nr:FAD-dependent monooxygenase [Fischerella sp. JS2]
MNTNILISGAGIAGLTLAYWLQKFNFNPTLLEKRSDLKDEGFMIDFYGSGFDIAEKMGILNQLQAKHYPISELKFINSQGKTQATLSIEKFRRMLDFRHFNFMRGDLETVLYETIKNTVPIQFNTSMVQMHLHPNQVEVEFSDHTKREYDLVIGTDGIHSQTRNILWGSESQFENFLGYYVACVITEDFLEDRDAFYTYMKPKKQVTICSIRGIRLGTLFAFKSEKHDVRTHQQKLDLLSDVFGKMGWIVPEILAAMKRSPHLYFDAVSQIKLTPWYKDRVALVGDACQCLTLLAGQGASMAMAGAYILATELFRTNGNYQVAFPAYQAQLQPEIAKRQIQAQKLASSFVPDNYFSIWMMNLFVKFMFLPGFSSIFREQIGAKSIIK